MFISIKLKRLVWAAVIFCLALYAVLAVIAHLFSVKNTAAQAENTKKPITWVDFTVPETVMEKAMKLDIQSHQQADGAQYNWIEILAYLAAKNGGNFKNSSGKEFNSLIEKLDSGQSMEELTKDMKYYNYYLEAYTAVLGGFVGEFQIQQPNENGEVVWVEKYGLKAFSPIAQGYYYSHYDDFGNGRSYGFARKHLGNDLMGSVGTPIISVESGVVEEIGWNQYGGWRIGIRSLDGKRYYYYAHLRKDHPYAEGLEKGQLVQAGDVIGYLGRTGYSRAENINNIGKYHLHFGIQLIFDESQKDTSGEIWIDVYQIVKLLQSNRSQVEKDPGSKDYHRVYEFNEPGLVAAEDALIE